MAWRLGLMAVWLVLSAFGSPAAAAIERFTDSRGVIHIRNAGAPPSRPQAAATLQEPVPPSPVSLPQAAAEPVSPANANPTAAVTAAWPADSPEGPSCLARDDGGSQKENGLSSEAGANPPELQAAGTGESAVALHLQQVAFTPPGGATPPVPLGPAPVQTARAADGAIKRFRDRQGVLHITNVPAPEALEPARLQAANAGEKAGPQNLAAVAAAAAQEGGPPALKRVSWTGDEPVLRALAAKGAAHRAAPPMPGAIRRYRDARGVWVIENVSQENEEAILEALLLARAARKSAGRAAMSCENYWPLANEGAAGGLAIKKAAWSEGDRGPPATGASKARGAKKSQLWAGETIKRYRDGKGVVHIKSTMPPEPRGAPTPAQLAAIDRQGLAGRTFAGPAAPGHEEKAAPGSPSGAESAAAGVMAYRDRKGKLVISNREPEIKIPRAPPGEGASAAYETAIAEASQAYSLPVALIKAVIKVESNFVPWAVSPKGAMGMMQLMPGTAEFLGVREPFNARENIHGGCRYLRLLLDYFGGNLPLALAAYNAGHQRVVACGYKVPPIKETQEFVTNVLGRYYTAETPAPWPWT